MRHPARAIIRADFAPAGSGGEGPALPVGTFLMDRYSIVTPIDAQRSRCVRLQTRDPAPDDAAVSARFAASVRGDFDEHRAVPEAAQRGLTAMPAPNLDLDLDLGIDAGPLRFRRSLARPIEAEGPRPVAAE